ncbi:alpha/beta fold family hydrolase, partial [Penicillium canescens]
MGLSDLIFPSAKISFFHSAHTVEFKRNKPDSKIRSTTSFADVCRSSTPPSCQLNPILFNGHLQTVWTVLSPRDIPIHYKRKIFESENRTYHGQFSVDFVVAPHRSTVGAQATDTYLSHNALPPRTSYFTAKEFLNLPSDDRTPMLIVLHGLSGGSYEGYVREFLAPMVSVSRGWEACVVNARGCAQTEVTSEYLYNARSTWDVRQTICLLRSLFPNRPLFGVGFSIGANILAKYLAEEGSTCLLEAAVLCSNPWNLETSALALKQTWIGLEVYMRTMGTNMRNICMTNIEQLSKNPRVDVASVKKIIYLHEFDRDVQCPTWGYSSEDAYYRDASSDSVILDIKVPFLAINAEDDPVSLLYISAMSVQIAVKEAIPYSAFAKTDYGVLCTTSWGGHLGWFELNGSRWLTTM